MNYNTPRMLEGKLFDIMAAIIVYGFIALIMIVGVVLLYLSFLLLTKQNSFEEIFNIGLYWCIYVSLLFFFESKCKQKERQP